jgi:glucokinase
VAGDLFLGTDTGGTGIKYVITEVSGKLVAEGEVPTDPLSITNSFQRVAAAVQEYRPRLQCVGMACAGIVDPVAGTLGRSPNLPGWENSSLAGMLSEIMGGLPVTLANDVNGALYGELKQGAGRGCRDVVMIALGTGVGGGVVLDGRLHLGRHCGGGEIGHTVLDPEGPTCTCGNRGCLEAYAGSVGLLARARVVAEELDADAPFSRLVADRGAELSTLDMARLAESGDPVATEVFAWAGRRLGQAVGNLINILDPDRIIIGGGVARAGELILGPTREMAPRIVLCAASARTPIVPAELGNLAASFGAAILAREDLTGGAG